LQKVRRIVKNLAQIYDESHSKYDGVICAGEDEKLNYIHYTEVVVFTEAQVFVAKKLVAKE